MTFIWHFILFHTKNAVFFLHALQSSQRTTSDYLSLNLQQYETFFFFLLNTLVHLFYACVQHRYASSAPQSGECVFVTQASYDSCDLKLSSHFWYRIKEIKTF